MKNLLGLIIEYYLSSPDFNGMPISSLKRNQLDEIQRLIQNGLVEAIAAVDNPHIKRFNRQASIEAQLKYVNDKTSGACLYPTSFALVDAPKDQGKKYTSLLQSGSGQFEVSFFKSAVLEPYFNNPEYTIADYGYRGCIFPKDNATEAADMIKDYGLAYSNNIGLDRGVAVFIHDLAALTEASQKKWESYEHIDQMSWVANANFTRNLILGEWTSEIWIFDALLMEQEIINDICDAIGMKHIFTKTWHVENWERPDGFRIILFPTQKNYYDFVIVLEKVVCNNISTKAFSHEQKYTKSVRDVEGKGSLSILGEWLKENGRNPQIVDERIVAPLKNIRKIRQTPAHDFFVDKYDKGIYTEQNKLIEEAF